MNTNFSIASIVGATFGFLLVIIAIVHGTDNYAAFLSLEGIMIVVGGSLAVSFMSFQANNVIKCTIRLMDTNSHVSMVH